MDRILLERQIEQGLHQQVFKRKQTNCSVLISTAALIVPVMWLGWKVSRKKWISRTGTYLAELGMLSLSTYFRTQLVNYLTNHQKSRPRD
jgi:hypothetical protein